MSRDVEGPEGVRPKGSIRVHAMGGHGGVSRGEEREDFVVTGVLPVVEQTVGGTGLTGFVPTRRARGRPLGRTRGDQRV